MTDAETDPYRPPVTPDALSPLPQRPRRVLVVGGLFCLVGGMVLCKILWELSQNRPFFDLLVLMLPVGIGLLKGRTSSKWWATLWLMFCYGMCLVFIVMDLANPGHVTVRGFGHEIEGGYSRPLFLSSAIAMGVVFIVMHYLLASRKSADYFREHRLRDLRESSRFRRGRRG
jgi:hypothetical protein